MNFEQNALLLLHVDGNNPKWVRPSDVFCNTPRWCRFTLRYPNAQIRDGIALPTSFQTLLDIKIWEARRNLLPELLAFASSSVKRFTEVEPWDAHCKYVFQALLCIKASDMVKEKHRWGYSDTLPSWIASIVNLEIYPVTRRNGSKELTRLTADIFIPDSPALNRLLQNKVDLLDFNGDEIYRLIRLLKFAAVPVKYLSSYFKNALVQLPSTSSPHGKAMSLLQLAKPFLARYFF